MTRARTRFAPASVALVAWLLGPTLTTADPQILQVGPQSEISVDLSGDPNDENDTALRLKNLSNTAGTVSIEYLPGPPLIQGDTIQAGFELVDGTLEVSSDLQPGMLRARYQIEYGVRRVRQAGVRANSLRPMRHDLRSGHWRRAVGAIRRVSGADLRFLRAQEADFVLGHHGFSSEKSYVWAVVDVNSRYAVGGLSAQAVPALPPLMLVVAGVGLIGLGLYRLRAR